MFYDSLASVQAIHELVAESMLLQHILNPLARLLLENESLVCLELYNRLFEHLFQMLTLLALASCID